MSSLIKEFKDEIISNTKDKFGEATINTVYDELKSKDKTYYDTINRVLETSDKETNRSNSFTGKSVTEAINSIFVTVNAMILDFIKFDPSKQNLSDAFNILFSDNRIIYTGIVVICLSLILLLIVINDG